jgi:signal transduction histidine kinase
MSPCLSRALPLLFLVLLLGGLVVPGSARAQLPAPAPMQMLTQAFTAEDRGEGRYPAAVPGASTALPDEWAHSRPGATSPLWYRLRFDAPASRAAQELTGLLVERACGDVLVQVNGQAVHSSADGDDLIALDCTRPILVALPAALIEPAGNVLDIRLTGNPIEHVASRQRAAALGELRIGPYALLHDEQQRGELLSATVPQGAASALLLMGLVFFVLGWWHPLERHLAYFGALSIAWALVTLRPWWYRLGAGSFVTEAAVVTLIGVAALLAIQFLLHFARRPRHALSGVLLAQCATIPLSLWLAGPSRLNDVATSWYLLLAAEVLAAIGWFAHGARVAQRRDFWPIVGLVAVAAVVVGIELTGRFALLPSAWRILPHLAMPLAFLGMGLLLVHQYGRALRSAEELRNSLESRIRDTTAAMERNFAQMAEMRVEQVTQQERKRIAADLHDDLGAKLLTIVHTSESERISTLAREALEEMRLSVRGLTGKPVKLIDALGDWRAEVVGRLSQTGVEGDWQAPADELPQTLSARAYVQTTRILREAVNNIIKHSGASRCSIRCSLNGGDFQLKIQDNGKGIPLEVDGRMDRGHGMQSMKHRAKQLHGQCLVESGPGYGTVIRLTIPLEKHTLPA